MVVVDLPGHGETGGRGNTLEDWLVAVDAAVDAHIDTLAVPVGFGAGGILATSWASSRPDRTWQVVLLKPPVPRPPACPSTEAEARAWWDAVRDGDEVVPAGWPGRAVQAASASGPWCGVHGAADPVDPADLAVEAPVHRPGGQDPWSETCGVDPLRSCPEEVVERVVAAVIDPRFR